MHCFSNQFNFFGRKFLLDLLTTKEHRNIIQWVGNDGKFQIIDQAAVAKLWGEREGSKSKGRMCYENLSRSLRYYYEKEEILNKKDCGRFEYRFSFDIKSNLGFTPQKFVDRMNGIVRPDTNQRRFPNYVDELFSPKIGTNKRRNSEDVADLVLPMAPKGHYSSYVPEYNDHLIL